MKKLLPIGAALALLTSCSMYRNSVVYNTKSIDYSSYSKNGFFITESNSVNFNYSPISSLSSIFISGYAETDMAAPPKEIKEAKFKDDVYSGPSKTGYVKKGTYVEATEEGVIKQLYEKALEVGATGIINLKISPITYTTKEGNILIKGYQGSGMAIKK
ncbi:MULTISPECIES: hypothetical protein [Olivibacter]|uniref:Lipoprotein n=1 Tax=Olivibacter jilunii TaxID=985016 RepID=A0ABW6B2G7_9SPHI